MRKQIGWSTPYNCNAFHGINLSPLESLVLDRFHILAHAISVVSTMSTVQS